MNNPTHPDLPPLADVAPPPMAVNLDAVVARSAVMKQRRHRRFAMIAVAACAAGAVAIAGVTGLSRNATPVPGASSATSFGPLFATTAPDGVVHATNNATYVITHQPTGAFLIAKRTANRTESLGVRQTFDGGWLANDGIYRVQVAVAPADASAAFVFSKAGANVDAPQPVRLRSGQTAVLTVSDSADQVPTVVGYRRVDGSYIGYGGGISGVREGKAEIVVSPKTQQWAGFMSSRDGRVAWWKTVPLTRNTMATGGEGAGASSAILSAALLPAGSTNIDTGSGPTPWTRSVPNTGYLAVLGVSEPGSTNPSSVFSSISWTFEGTTHRAQVNSS